MFLSHICSTTGKSAEAISFADFGYKTVLSFLDAKEKEKNWTPKTGNHRLGVIRSFFKYAVAMEPTLAHYLEELKNVPRKKTQNKTFILEYMSQNAITALLCQPDTSKRMGIRDTFFMSLMYDTAARDYELLSMRFHDIDPVGKKVYLLGKGDKPRFVSIDDNTITQFHRYAKLFHPTSDGNQLMFYTTRHGEVGQMSDDNVARFLSKYANEARKCCKDVPEHIYPHMVRRSRAMHMYQGGMPLEVIALILGHEDPLTTRIYAKADLEMKRKAMEKVKEKGFDSKRPEIESTAIWVGNEEMIRILCGLD
jgi:site-specific recombinase XerD